MFFDISMESDERCFQAQSSFNSNKWLQPINGVASKFLTLHIKLFSSGLYAASRCLACLQIGLLIFGARLSLDLRYSLKGIFFHERFCFLRRSETYFLLSSHVKMYFGKLIVPFFVKNFTEFHERPLIKIIIAFLRYYP